MKKLLLSALALSLSFAISAQELRTLDLVDPAYREAAKGWGDFSDAAIQQQKNTKLFELAQQLDQSNVCPTT